MRKKERKMKERKDVPTKATELTVLSSAAQQTNCELRDKSSVFCSVVQRQISIKSTVKPAQGKFIARKKKMRKKTEK